MRFASRPIRTSWWTRSKNFSRSTSTTQRRPSWMYFCASHTASCARRPGRKPWLCDEKVGSNCGCRTCKSACWMNRSSTVGMPSSRMPPSLFGMSCRLTGWGLYVPASSCSRSTGQVARRWSRSASTVIPSMPGLPLFFCTRFNAAMTLPRSTTRSIRSAPSFPERSFPCAAVDASPLRSALGASPLPSSGSSSCPDFWRMASSRFTGVSLSSPFGPSRRQSLPRFGRTLLGSAVRYYGLC